jgi:hypothetical protein
VGFELGLPQQHSISEKKDLASEAEFKNDNLKSKYAVGSCVAIKSPIA